MDPVLARWDRSPDLTTNGVSFLLYGLLDVVIDGYFDTVQSVRRVLRRGQRGDLLRAAARPGPAASLVRDATGRSSASTVWSCRCAKRSAG